MLLAALICMAVACVLIAVSLCFVTKYKTISFLLRVFLLIAIMCLGFVSANYKNTFNGYTILIILSVIPMFLSLFDLEAYLSEKKAKIAEINTENTADSEQPTVKNTKSKHYFANSNGMLLKSVAFLLPSICIGFAGLYLGIETYLGFLIGLALALAGSFLILILKKQVNPFDLLAYFLSFLAIGICLGQILTVIIYAQTITNILYCIGSFVYCIFVGFSIFMKTEYDHLLYLMAIIALFLTFIL